MARTFVDADLREWEAYPSGGLYGLPDDAKLVFHCLSDPDERPRFVRRRGEDNAEVAAEVEQLGDDELRALFAESEPLP
ncbi:MAG: hypothetical protein M3409_09420 [Gemmatimonadota bacterium]|jgi:hypothetical protein|nr:hypothetical protein [Gemmatimonadota bacterium]